MGIELYLVLVARCRGGRDTRFHGQNMNGFDRRELPAPIALCRRVRNEFRTQHGNGFGRSPLVDRPDEALDGLDMPGRQHMSGALRNR